MPAPADTTLLLASSAGFGLMAKAGDMQGRNRSGKAFLTLDDGQLLLPPRVVLPGHRQVACLAADGRLLVFALDELKLQPGGGKGLTLMDVDASAALLSVAPLADVLVVQGSGRGGKPKEETLKNRRAGGLPGQARPQGQAGGRPAKGAAPGLSLQATLARRCGWPILAQVASAYGPPRASARW